MAVDRKLKGGNGSGSGSKSVVSEPNSAGPTPKENPWLLLQAYSGDVMVFAMCLPHVAIGNLPKRGESVYAGTSTVVEIRRKAQSPTDSPQSEWWAWIAWRTHARFMGLDVMGVCSRCGHIIRDAAVSDDGMVLIGH